MNISRFLARRQGVQAALFTCGLLAACCMFCWLLPATAQAASTADALQEKYKTLPSMRADFTQVLVHKESGSKEKRSGTISFKKPLLMRWETKQPSPELLVVGEKDIWNAFPEEELAYRYAIELAQDSRSIIQVITGQASLGQDFFVEEAGEEKGLRKLVLYPKEASQSMVEAALWVDTKSFLIKRVLVYDFFGNENDIAFSRQETGVAFPAGMFAFTPPKGWEVEDKRQESGANPKNF